VTLGPPASLPSANEARQCANCSTTHPPCTLMSQVWSINNARTTACAPVLEPRLHTTCPERPACTYNQGGSKVTRILGINAQAVPFADASATTPRLPSCLPAHVTATRATHPAPRLPPHLKTNAPNGLATITPPTAAGHHTHHTRQAWRLHEALQASPTPGPECRVRCSEAPSC
jgi:hypothetical protein